MRELIEKRIRELENDPRPAAKLVLQVLREDLASMPVELKMSASYMKEEEILAMLPKCHLPPSDD